MPSWAPNPYAIAQRLSGRQDIKFLSEAKGVDADKFLKQAFQLDEKKRTLVQALKPFRVLSDAVREPLPLEKVMALNEFKTQFRGAGYSDEQLRRVLPLLVQVSDARIESAAEPQSLEPVIASWRESDRLLIDQPTYLDPIQGDTADCYLVSAMIGVAWASPSPLQTGLNSAGFETGSFSWKFHKEERGSPSEVNVSSRVPRDGDFPLFARSHEPAEYWPSLIEKAYVVRVAKKHRHVLVNDEPEPADYQFIANGDVPQDACQELIGGIPRQAFLDLESGKRIFSFSTNPQLRGKLATASGIMSRPVMTWTEMSTASNSAVWENIGLLPNHAYTVLGVIQSGDTVEHVVLRNPYGYAIDEATRPGYRSGFWEPEGREPVQLGRNGVFAIARELFYQHFKNIGWVDPLSSDEQN